MLNQARAPDNAALVEQVTQHPWREQFASFGLTFEDDIWDLQFRTTTAARPGDNKLTFDDFPLSIKEEVKLFLSRGLLEAGYSNGWMIRTHIVLRKFVRVLTARYGSNIPLLQLAQQDAIAVEDHFRQSAGVNTRDDVAMIARFARFLREQHDGQPADFLARSIGTS